MRRLWVVSELYYPEETSTGHFMTAIAEALAERFDVRVLTNQPTYSARGTRALRIERRNGVTIRRCRATTFDKRNLLPRLVNVVTITLSLFLNAVMRVRRGDVVLAVTNPPSLPWMVALACRVRGGTFVLLVHDVYPDGLVAAGLTRPDSFMAKVIRKATTWAYRSARHVVTIGRDMQKLVQARIGDGRRVNFIPNWADDEVEPRLRSQSSLIHELGIAGDFIVEYAGNIGTPNDFDTILAAAERLKDEHGIRFLILGWGSRENWVRSEVEARNLTNVILAGSRPRADQNDFLSAADLAVISLRQGMLGVAMPSRTYNTMASQRPILATCEPDSELWLLINEENIGWAVRPGDVQGFVDAILVARDAVTLRTEMGYRARSSAVTRYSRSRILEEWRRLLGDLDRDPERA